MQWWHKYKACKITWPSLTWPGLTLQYSTVQDHTVLQVEVGGKVEKCQK